jgi:lysyl-tRNA synthetase class 2
MLVHKKNSLYNKDSKMQKTLEELKKIRLQKLDKIKNQGINPYPARCNRKQTITQALQMMGQKVSVAGRIMAIRGHGGIQFFDLRDESGKIQLLFKRDKLSTTDCKLLTLLDIGDFIDVSGEITKTQAGEISVLVESVHLLTKSIRPLPSQWYGLKDVEERYRKRYLDLIMNNDVKDALLKRSKITHAIRKFLIEKRGYIEVENPVLQTLYGGGRAKPFITHLNTLDTDFYLRISNELYLKRCIVGGFEKVFEMNHVFRNEGMDKNHNPEFTMLETMEAYADYQDNMKLIEEMFEYVALEVFGTTKLVYQGMEIDYKSPWQRIKLADLFKKHIGLDINEVRTLEKAIATAKKLGVAIQDFMTDGEILLEIFEKKCTCELIQPTFVYDYPADFYPLAKRCDYDDSFVESFDIYVAKMEMGTNWSEQNDPLKLRQTWEEEAKKAAAGNEEAQKLDNDFLEALEYGMPPTSGIGPGIDRWVMVMTNSHSLSDVIMFPIMKTSQSNITTTQRINIKTSLPDEHSQRFVAILSKKVDIGKLVNALGHMTAGLVGGYTNSKGMCFLVYEDKDGGIHPNISHFPFIVLKADNSNQIKEVREKALEQGISFTDFVSTMTIGTSKEQQEATKKTPADELEYFGICLFGMTDELKELTKKFSLFK